METAFLSYQLPQLPRAQKQARNSTQLLLQPHPVANKLPTALRIYLATLQMGITSLALHVYPVLGNRRDHCIPVAGRWHHESPEKAIYLRGCSHS